MGDTLKDAMEVPPVHPSVAALREEFGDAVLRDTVEAGDEQVVYIDAARNVDVLQWLHREPEQLYGLLVDLTAVDYGSHRGIEVVYQLWSIPHRRQLRIKAELNESELEIRTVTGIWATANWLEREVFDMFGIRFRGHPDLRRILMPADYAEGHPLRKDFPLRGRLSRSEQTRRVMAGSMEGQYTREEIDAIRRKRARRVPDADLDRGPAGTAGGS